VSVQVMLNQAAAHLQAGRRDQALALVRRVLQQTPANVQAIQVLLAALGPGEVSQGNLVSPEFQITSETTIVTGANFTQQLLGAGGRSGPLRFNLLPFQSPQVTSDAALLDKIDLLLFGGAMSDGTRGILTTALADPDFPSASPNQRTLTLLWLASMTPEAVVQK